MIYHPKIKFLGQTNYDFDLITATFNPDNGETDTYLDMEPVYTDSFDGTLRTDYGAKYKSVAIPSVTFVEVDSTDITPFKVRQVLRWLTGYRKNSWMEVCDKDGETIVSYLGRFTNVKLQKMDGRVIGIVAEFTSVSPWAYSGVKTVTMSVNGSSSDFKIDNQSDDLYSCVYPTMVFQNKNDKADLSIKNITVGNETVFKNLQQDEVITIDNNFVVYSDNTGRIFNDDFNYVFPALAAGTNAFDINGTGELTIKFRYPMKVADGLLNNYDLRNGLVIWVEAVESSTKLVAAKIKGDVTLNPPNGVNIRVEGSKMIVRGTFKDVKLESSISVHNGVLDIDEGSDTCPFDEFDAEVVDGVLIIPNGLKYVERAE